MALISFEMSTFMASASDDSGSSFSHALQRIRERIPRKRIILFIEGVFGIGGQYSIINILERGKDNKDYIRHLFLQL